MLKLLERNVTHVNDHLAVLASPNALLPLPFRNVEVDSPLYESTLADLQRLRGSVYLNDGAIKAGDLTDDLRHDTPEDHKAWHLLMIDERRDVTGCIWYMEHTEPRFESLRIRQSPVAMREGSAMKLRMAVEQNIARARRERVSFAEVGGWAVSKDSQITDCLLLILGTFALSQLLGGAYVVATATFRHSSAAILQRLGGAPMTCDGKEIPPYFDPHYGCEMEVLQFDTRRPAAKFVKMVNHLKASFGNLSVVATDGRVHNNNAQTTLGPARVYGVERLRHLSVA